MARVSLFISLMLCTIVLFGCFEDNVKKRFMAPEPEPVSIGELMPTATAEVSLAEKVTLSRDIYRNNLEMLSEYYKQTGNSMKQKWVTAELSSLASAPRYQYILKAEAAGPELHASKAITRADNLYYKAMGHYKKAKGLVVIIDDKEMRLALRVFNELIEKFPTSDKIDDAAYRAGQIYEHFKDYNIAVLYYTRTFQWDAKTIYPARYKAATLLDRRLHKRHQALALYKAVVENESGYEENKEFAQQRIDTITASEKLKYEPIE